MSQEDLFPLVLHSRFTLELIRYLFLTSYTPRYRPATEELDGPAVSALRRVIAEVKQSWSVIGWVTKNFFLELLRASEGTSLWSPAPVSGGFYAETKVLPYCNMHVVYI
jgi:hypothetical protein